jgi:putative addiction module component (TIGR02574 family)
MSDKLKTVWEAAVVLDREERAELAGRLLGTLDDQSEDSDEETIDLAWAEEADRRFQAYKRGEMKTVPVEEIRKMLQPETKP